jgi:hypothetical protein
MVYNLWRTARGDVATEAAGAQRGAAALPAE